MPTWRDSLISEQMKRRRALITGVAGFAGSWLAEELIEQNYEVTGTVLPREPLKNLRSIKNQLELVPLDIRDQKSVKHVIKRLKPDYIFHLAAFASVGRSFGQERLVYDINFNGTLNILDAAVEVKSLKKLVFVSSCDTYGVFSPKSKVLTETQAQHPVSPYGISKVAAEHAALLAFNRNGLPVTIARSFNHSGPRQSQDFVIPSFAAQIARIEKGKQPSKIKVGDLSARRDLTDVRDIVRGYRLLAEKGKPGRVYHLCTGKAIAIQTVLDKLLKLAEKKITVTIDKSRLRKNDIPVLRGSNKRAVQELKWSVRYKIDETLKSTLDHWRASV